MVGIDNKECSLLRWSVEEQNAITQVRKQYLFVRIYLFMHVYIYIYVDICKYVYLRMCVCVYMYE